VCGLEWGFLSRGEEAEKRQKIKSPTNELSQEDGIKLEAQTTVDRSEMSPMGTGSGNCNAHNIVLHTYGLGVFSSCL